MTKKKTGPKKGKGHIDPSGKSLVRRCLRVSLNQATWDALDKHPQSKAHLIRLGLTAIGVMK